MSRLIDEHGRDLGEIYMVAAGDSRDLEQLDVYTVYVRKPGLITRQQATLLAHKMTKDGKET